NRSFYALVNAVPLFQRLGVGHDALVQLVHEIESQADREPGGSKDATREVVLLTKSRVDIDSRSRQNWLNEFSHRLLASHLRTGSLTNRERLSFWVSLIVANRSLASDSLLSWATRSAK